MDNMINKIMQARAEHRVYRSMACEMNYHSHAVQKFLWKWFPEVVTVACFQPAAVGCPCLRGIFMDTPIPFTGIL